MTPENYREEINTSYQDENGKPVTGNQCLANKKWTILSKFNCYAPDVQRIIGYGLVRKCHMQTPDCRTCALALLAENASEAQAYAVLALWGVDSDPIA